MYFITFQTVILFFWKVSFWDLVCLHMHIHTHSWLFKGLREFLLSSQGYSLITWLWQRKHFKNNLWDFYLTALLWEYYFLMFPASPHSDFRTASITCLFPSGSLAHLFPFPAATARTKDKHSLSPSLASFKRFIPQIQISRYRTVNVCVCRGWVWMELSCLISQG